MASKEVLYIVVCAAGAASKVPVLIGQARARVGRLRDPDPDRRTREAVDEYTVDALDRWLTALELAQRPR